MKTSFTIGKFLKPRGLKGELKFEMYTSDPKRFLGLKTVNAGGEDYKVIKITVESDFGYMLLDGVDTPEKAERLRGAEIRVERAALPALPKDRFYIADILGLDVFVGGERVGEVADVLQYGSADVYVIRMQSGSVSVPVIGGLVKDVDLDNGRMAMDDIVFSRVAVFNP